MRLGLEIYSKKFILLFLAFIALTIIGTLSHELGHIAVAKALGFQSTLHYASMTYDQGEFLDYFDTLQAQHNRAKSAGEAFKYKDEYMAASAKLIDTNRYVKLGGPLQTLLTGVFGLLWFYFRRRKHRHFNTWDWLAIMLSLFWLRQVFNLLIGMLDWVLQPSEQMFGGDELHISRAFQLWDGTVSVVTGLLGILIFTWVVFWMVPRQFRVTFLLSGLCGGVLGFVLWMGWLGPVLLP